MSKKKKVEIKIELDAEKLEEVLETTENQKLALELPPDRSVPIPSEEKDEELEKVKDEEWKKEPSPVKIGDKLPESMLKSTMFQPICNRRFVFCMDGLDSFLVKRVERPSYVRPKSSWQEKKADYERLEELNAHKRLVVYLHDVISPSTRHQVSELVNITAFPLVAQIKLLDPVGTVIGLYTYSGVEVERVDYDALDYADNRVDSQIKLTLSYRKERMDY